LFQKKINLGINKQTFGNEKIKTKHSRIPLGSMRRDIELNNNISADKLLTTDNRQ